jgi:hypothetical protein
MSNTEGMSNIKIAAWVASIICTVLFIARIAALSKIQTAYGSPASSPPVIFGLFIACAIIPGILWIIVATKKSKNSPISAKKTNVFGNSTDSEIKTLKEKTSSIERIQKDHIEKFNLLNTSLEQKLISKEKHSDEEQKLRTEFDRLKDEKQKLTKRIQAINSLSEEFLNLDKLLEKSVITSEEKAVKREELINSKINLVDSDS